MPDQGNRYEFIGERLETPGIVLDDKWIASGREAERLAGGLMLGDRSAGSTFNSLSNSNHKGPCPLHDQA